MPKGINNLPINDVVDELKEKLINSDKVILGAPPGAGKSTLLPLKLLNEPWLNGEKIIMLEPRRLAVKSVAKRLAEINGDGVGETVGYRIRFETRVSEKTKIEVVTEGILTRMLQSDQALDGVGLVIFDEFHERSIHADLALALCLESQQVLRPDLKLLVMSATLDTKNLIQTLKCPVVESEGRQYPVEVKYVGGRDKRLLPEMTAKTILQALKETKGDVLVFLPGQGEINRTEEALKGKTSGAEIHKLYGSLPFKVQQKAIEPSEKRKIVLATSIAETSLTIKGITTVVDCGYARTQIYNPNTALSSLQTVDITNDSADQRAGRAGRLGPGVCYRMWDLADQNRIQKHRTPEILSADLTALVLEMYKWGIKDINSLIWLDAPSKGSVSQAKELLESIGAVENQKITAHGLAIHRLPCHPRLAHLLVCAEDLDLVELGTDICAVLEERDPLPRNSGIDLNLRLEALRRFRVNNGKGGVLGRIEKLASSYRKLLDCELDNEASDDFEVGLLVAQAFPERIACARPGNNAQFQLANGQLAQASHKDDLSYETWLAVAHLDARDGQGKIFMASPLNPKDLASFVKEERIVEWDELDNEFVASKQLRIGNIVLQSKPLVEVSLEDKCKAICKAVKKNGERLLSFNDAFKNWQSRVLSLKRWNEEAGWPDVSVDELLLSCEKWLSPYLSEVNTGAQLKKLDLKEILHFSLSHKQQGELLQLAPERIKVPSGSEIKLEYFNDGRPPVLAVRIQELFGLEDTPLVNNGENPVLIHLLSPGFKPVQVTQDLRSFWAGTYFEVRKELKRRYPKHHWPDDPTKEEPLKGVKRKK